MKENDLFGNIDKPSADSLFVVYNGVVAKMNVAEIFDAKVYSDLKAVSYVSSPKFFAETVKNFKTVTFILGINDSDNLNKFSDGISVYLDNSDRMQFFNDLPNEAKTSIIENNLKIRYGKIGVMIHDKIYLMSNAETSKYRVVIGSANFSQAAFNSENYNFENIRVDDSESLYNIYLARFNYLLSQTNDYIPERCRKTFKDKQVLLNVTPDTNLDLLIDELGNKKISVIVTPEQMDVISRRSDKLKIEQASAEIVKMVSDVVFDAMGSDGNFGLKRTEVILKKKSVLRNIYHNNAKIKKDDADFRKTLLMNGSYNIYESADQQSDCMQIYSKAIDKADIKTALQKINMFTQAYLEFSLTPNPVIASRIYELILYAFTSPFIWKIRQKCALMYDKATVADIPIFFIMSGIRESGKSTALEFVAHLLGQAGRQVYNYSRDLDKAGNIYSLIMSNNLMPVFADEVGNTFFRRSNTARKGEEMLKTLSNTVPDEAMGTMIGTTNLKDFSSSGQVIRRIYYVEVDNMFDSKRKRESMEYLRGVYDGLGDELFKDFTFRFAEVIRSKGDYFEIDDFLKLTRTIFLNYYEEVGVNVPEYFPQGIFRDYDARKYQTWRRLFFANRSHFIDKGDVIQVNIDEIFRNSGNAGKQKEKLLNYLDETCLASDSDVGVNWFLRKKEFYKFIDYTPTLIEQAKHSFKKFFDK